MEVLAEAGNRDGKAGADVDKRTGKYTSRESV